MQCTDDAVAVALEMRFCVSAAVAVAFYRHVSSLQSRSG